MTPFTEEAERLLRLAERDYRSFSILADHPDGDAGAACFHAQQSVEKALKAVLTLHQVDFPRTHNLEALAGLVVDLGVTSPVPLSDLRRLNPYAVNFRYDDQLIQLLSLAEADSTVLSILNWARSLVLRASSADTDPC
jgi:HEPN domain-containing protein